MQENVPENITICGCFAKQPIGEFFAGVISSDILCRITFTDTRRLNSRVVEEYSGLNRPINPDRVREISQYVETAEATFPNSIIVAIDSENIIAQDERSLTLKVAPDVAKIIDGQHRITGLQKASSTVFDLVVSIFVDIPIEDQAEIFSTINLKQARVDKSLVYDLFDLSTERSPQKTCHDIAKSLNFDKDSPFFERIKLLGRNPKLLDGSVLYKAPLTQAAFVKHLLPMISDNPDRDRDLIKRGNDVECPSNSKEKGTVFCKYFKNKEDEIISRILTNYFDAVRQVFPDEWNTYDNPLSKTIGYGALMRLLKNDLFSIGENKKDLSSSFFKEYVERLKGKVIFTFDEYAPAGSGESKLYEDLRKAIFPDESL
jgi:DGQHR domain-containing protein